MLDDALPKSTEAPPTMSLPMMNIATASDSSSKFTIANQLVAEDTDSSFARGTATNPSPNSSSTTATINSTGTSTPAGVGADIMADTNIDLTTLPRDYLESYPYPAFVLVSPIPPSGGNEDRNDGTADESSSGDFGNPSSSSPPLSLPFTRSSYPSVQPFHPVWANSQWRKITRGRPLLDCLSVNSARRLGDWLSGALEARSASTSLPTPTQTISARRSSEPHASPIKTPTQLAPDGFWEREINYDDWQAAGKVEAGHSVTSFSQNTTLPPTLTVNLVGPAARVTLELAKTSLPLWQYRRNGRKRMGTHTFTVITTTPRIRPGISSISSVASMMSRADSPLPPGATMSLSDPTVIPSPELIHPNIHQPKSTVLPPLLTAATLTLPSASKYPSFPTPIEELDMENLVPKPNSAEEPSRPIFFHRDGKVSQHVPPQSVEAMDGGSRDVHTLLKTMDWSKTPLGPREKWPQSLQSIVSLVMLYPHQCCLWWGKELTLIYNAPYAENIHKHPHIFGMSGPVAWAEIWHILGPLSELVLGGTPVYKEDDFLLFKQLPHQGNGTFEVYHSWMWVPVLQEDGTFGGLWNATHDTTTKVLAERRLATVREMGERTTIARTLSEFDRAVIDILASNPKDVPFALLYHVSNPSNDNKRGKSPVPDDPGRTRVDLEYAGGIGVPDSHPSAPPTLSLTLRSRRSRPTPTTGAAALFSDTLSPPSPTTQLRSSYSSLPMTVVRSSASGATSASTAAPDDDGTASGRSSMYLNQWPFEEALQSHRLVLVEDCLSLIEGYPIRIWDELPSTAIVVPIASDSDESIPSAILVLGLSCRRPFDDAYESFIHVLRLQMASGITAVRSYEAEQQRIHDLAALDRAKSMLFSNVSHELRTPLTLVSGPLDDLLLETQAGPKRDTLLMARRNVRRLTRLVSTLMDVSSLEAGRLKGSFRPVNLGLMTRDLAALFRAAIERAKLEYIVACDETEHDVYVDAEHWEKIMFNLIGNALKYTMKGFIHVYLSYTATEVVFAVEDSGYGIPKADLEVVGERFHRVQSVSRSHEGTGIGLSLVKELVKLHGGVLEIESSTSVESLDGSHGSVFRVRIPLGFEHLPPGAVDRGEMSTMFGAEIRANYGQSIVDEAMQWFRDRDPRDLRDGSSNEESSESGGSGSGSGTGSGSGFNTGGGDSIYSSRGMDPSTLYFKRDDVIMIVDDSPDTTRYIRSIFAHFCTLIEARDGIEALEKCSERIPDLIITDIMMPRLDGFGLLAALKEGSREQKMIPIIMLTAQGGDEARVDGLLAGADDYLSKPFNARELIARAHMQIQIGKRRRALEDAFDERTAELRTLSEHLPVGIFRCTPDGNVIYANGAWHDMAGYPRDTPIGTSWADYIIPEHRSRIEELWESFRFSDDKYESAEWQWTNGRWATARVIRLGKVAQGPMPGFLGCITDITERKMHEESQRLRVIEAEQRRAEAEEDKRQQELLIDITSYHLFRLYCSSLVKTNLVALHEQLEKSLDSGGTFAPTRQLLATIDEDLDALESIYQCGLTQERISNDVLSLGRIQLDMLQMFDVEMDIRREAQKVTTIFQNEARMKRIALTLRLGESVAAAPAIKTDPVRLGQIVTNLLANAIRFTAASHVRRIELRYDVSTEAPSDENCMIPSGPISPELIKDDTPLYLYVSVKDTGPGLGPKELEILFQRFSQASPKTHTVFGGSGLGLFVCRKITELMGGRIEVTSELGQGSTFRFFIRARASVSTSKKKNNKTRHSGAIGVRSSQRRSGTPTNPASQRIGWSIPHVLVVEDNMINQTVLVRQLKHVGFTVQAANNGLEAVELIRQAMQTRPFTCVLMDLEMPIMNGYEATRVIRTNEAVEGGPVSRIVALTGNARQAKIDEAMADFDDVIIKPYRLDDLLLKIENVVEDEA